MRCLWECRGQAQAHLTPEAAECEAQAAPLVAHEGDGHAAQPRSRRTALALSGLLAATLGAAGVLARRGRPATAGSALVGLAECEDTPGWTNGWTACKDEKGGQDPTLCTSTGWTCKGYVARGICGSGEPKAFAMGPGLNSPEMNCCACKNFKRKSSCVSDTGGTCFLTQHCNGWRGAAKCEGGRCVCQDGYCATAGGTCKLAARAAWMHRKQRNESIQEVAPACSRVTSGTCVLPTMVCEDYRGPTTCSAGQCTCVPGYCTDLAGMCFRAMGLVKAQVVPVNRLGQAFPGVPVRTALCVSGGGARSMSAAMGQFRALYRLGLLPQVDLVSSISGGSWASAILTFADMDLGTLLGNLTPPSVLTLAALDATPPPFGAVLMNRTTDIALELRRHKVPYRMLWVETVGRAFLEPFGLYDLEAFMAADDAAVQRIIATNPQYKGSRFLVPKPGRARSLVMSGTLLSPDGFKAAGSSAMALQMSPDFTGVPFYPNNATVNYSPTDLTHASLENVLVGGGLVESFAFGGPAPPQRKGQLGGEAVQLFAPASPFSLAKAVGISSAAFAGESTQLIGLGENLNPQANVWPVTSNFHPRPQAALPYQLGDGGLLENTGVAAALQRGATRIAAMINTDTPFDMRTNFCEAPPDLNLHGKASDQLAQLFGLLQSTGSAQYHVKDQVFASADFLPLLCDFQRLKTEGRALVVPKQLVVQANPWWGIGGGATVDVIFVLLDSAFGFQDLLPQETQTALGQGPIGGLSGFPNFKTTFQNFPDLTRYTARQINLVAALSEWAVLQNAAEFRKLLTP